MGQATRAIPFQERTLGEMLINANLEGRLQELVRW